jgi:ribosomal protein L28
MRKCARCEKTSQMQGARKLLRGHYNPVNWSRKYPNLQYATVDGKRMLICTKCLRTLHKAPHVRKAAAKSSAAPVAA